MDDRRIGKDLKGSSLGLTKVISLPFPGAIEGNQERNPVRITGVPVANRTKHLTKMNLKHYRYINRLGHSLLFFVCLFLV
jgi:hypothetical protein